MERKDLSEKSYWDSGYNPERVAQRKASYDIYTFRHLAARRVVRSIENLNLRGKSVLEVGAGDSDILPVLAKRNPDTKFCGLDYSELGCAALRAKTEGMNVDVVQSDMLDIPESLKGKFDVLYSLGVVEHFGSLAEVLLSLGAYLKPGGVMFTLIPNMHGVLGKLTKRWNRTIFDMHNPHSLQSFIKGHRDAGLLLKDSGYLCSTNFLVLSSCFSQSRNSPFAYKFLVATTAALWFIESRFGELPKTAYFSPYMYAVSTTVS